MKYVKYVLLFSSLFATSILPITLTYNLLIKNETPYTFEVAVGKKTYTAGYGDESKTLVKDGVWNLSLWTTVDRVYMKLATQHASEIKALFQGRNELSFPIDKKYQGKDYALKIYINEQNQLAAASCWQ
jgi:hypothetical protein